MLQRAVRTSLRSVTVPRIPAAVLSAPRALVHNRPVNGVTYNDVRPKVSSTAFVAFNATLVGEVHLHDKASVYYTAVVRADNTPVVIGECTNIQEGAVLHSDPDAPLAVGKGVTVGHRAILHGCQIADNVLIGMGATVMNNAVIGENSIIGANALVTANTKIPANSLVMGAPAKVVREVKPHEIEGIKASAKVYTDKIASAKAGKPLYFE